MKDRTSQPKDPNQINNSLRDMPTDILQMIFLQVCNFDILQLVSVGFKKFIDDMASSFLTNTAQVLIDCSKQFADLMLQSSSSDDTWDNSLSADRRVDEKLLFQLEQYESILMAWKKKPLKTIRKSKNIFYRF